MHELTRKFNKFYGPAIFSGLMLVLSFPEFDIYPLAWIAMTPLLISLFGVEKKIAFKIGFVFGVVFFFGTTYWIYHSIYIYGSVPFVLSILLVFILSFYLSIYPAIFSVLYSLCIRRTDLPALFVAPVFWTALEFLRSYALTGFPWSSLGYSQYKFLPIIQFADITGIYGVSFLLLAFNGAIADLFLLKKRRSEKPLYSLIPTLSGSVILFILLAFTLSYGIFRLDQKRDGNDIRFAVIQGNIEQDRKWDRAYQDEVINTYKELSISASKYSPDMIVWPETAIPFYFGKDRFLTDEIISFQSGLNAYLLFGSILEKERDKESAGKSSEMPYHYTNSAVLLNRDGNISYIYDKIHLVPFGEYVPLKNILFFVNKLTVGIGDYTPGNSYIKAVSPFGNFGTLICYEIIFPGLVRKFYTKNGDFIVTITNDAWFGKTNGPYQHFSMAVFRAIENRKPVIRAANTGISGFIDSNGRILEKTRLFERVFLVKDIRSDRTLTIYTKYGDIFSYLCIVFSIFLIIKKK